MTLDSTILGYRVRIAAIILVTAAASLCVASSAQNAAPISVTGTTAINTYNAVTSVQEDFIPGKGVKGPYVLTWKGLRSGSATVLRDGATLRVDSDFTVDYAAGTISFASVLAEGQISRVDYVCDPAAAAPNSTSITVPFAWDLYQNGKSSLVFNSVFHNDSVARQNRLVSSVDWVGNTHIFSNSTLTSGVYVDLRGGDWLNRSAFDVSDRTKLKLADLSLTYSRAGTQFLQGAASGLTAGREITEFLATVHPSSAVTLNTTLRETTVLTDVSSAPGTAATTTDTASETVSVKLPMHTQIQAGIVSTSVTSPGANTANTTTENVKLDSDLSNKTHLSSTYDASAVSPVGAAQAAQTQSSSISVTSKAIDEVSITGSLKNAVAAAGSTDAGVLSAEATPFARDRKKKQMAKLKIKAAVQTSIAPGGASNLSSAQIEIPSLPVAQTTIVTGILHSTDPIRTQTVGQLDATAKPTKFLELSGGARLRDAILSDNTPDPNAVNTYNMKVLFGPSKRIKLTGSFASNPEAADGTVRRSIAQMVGLESDEQFIKLTGQIGSQQDSTASRLTNNLLLGVDLRITSHDILSTTWEGHTTQDTVLNETSIYRLAFTHKLGSTVDVSVSGSMTQTAINGTPASAGGEVKAEAKIGLHF